VCLSEILEDVFLCNLLEHFANLLLSFLYFLFRSSVGKEYKFGTWIY
jgi:hypothetical protein